MEENQPSEQDKPESTPDGYKSPPEIDGLNSILPAEFKQLLEGIPQDKKEEIGGAFVGILMAKKSSYRGPLPPPEMLAKYNDALPNGAERVFAMAEKQANHRIELEKSTIAEEQRQSSRGQHYGFIVSLLGLTIAGVLAYFGHDWFAGILGTTTIIGLVTVFVKGKMAQEKDLDEKSNG